MRLSGKNTCDCCEEELGIGEYANQLEQELANYKAGNESLIDEVIELRRYKTSVEEAHRVVMDEKCPSDEVHCTCVPALRAENGKLRTMVTEREDLVDEVESLMAEARTALKTIANKL